MTLIQILLLGALSFVASANWLSFGRYQGNLGMLVDLEISQTKVSTKMQCAMYCLEHFEVTTFLAG